MKAQMKKWTKAGGTREPGEIIGHLGVTVACSDQEKDLGYLSAPSLSVWQDIQNTKTLLSEKAEKGQK